jgi:hypothetical protein
VSNPLYPFVGATIAAVVSAYFYDAGAHSQREGAHVDNGRGRHRLRFGGALFREPDVRWAKRIRDSGR